MTAKKDGNCGCGCPPEPKKGTKPSRSAVKKSEKAKG
jgi:hypothetical protein